MKHRGYTIQKDSYKEEYYEAIDVNQCDSTTIVCRTLDATIKEIDSREDTRIMAIVEDEIERMFVEAVDSFGLDTGDISPHQTMQLNVASNIIAEVIKAFVEQNRS